MKAIRVTIWNWNTTGERCWTPGKGHMCHSIRAGRRWAEQHMGTVRFTRYESRANRDFAEVSRRNGKKSIRIDQPIEWVQSVGEVGYW